MARSRNIKPGFFTNDGLAELPALTRLLFIGLWTIADRSGRLEDRPKRIKAEVMPYDSCNIESMLKALHDGGFILRYDANGTPAIQIITWDKHQNPHIKEQLSVIPAPDKNSASTRQARKARVTSTGNSGTCPADSGFLIPDSGFPHSDSLTLIPDSLNLIPDKRQLPATPAGAAVPPTRAVWQAYSEAYQERYKQPPVRNAAVNGVLAQLVSRLGAEAPDVARFYLSHNKTYYVSSSHSVQALLKDAEGLRTQWATGRQVTATQAVQADKTQTNFNAFAGMLAEAERNTHAQP